MDLISKTFVDNELIKYVTTPITFIPPGPSSLLLNFKCDNYLFFSTEKKRRAKGLKRDSGT